MPLKLKDALEAGLLIGLKVLVALAVVLLGAGWIIGDYTSVRIGAQQGAAAFEFIQKAQQQQQKPPTAK